MITGLSKSIKHPTEVNVTEFREIQQVCHI